MDDLGEFLGADMEFHRTIVAAGRNKALLAAFDAIREYHRFSQALTSYRQGEARRTIAQHRRILDALRAGNPGRAAASLLAHLDRMSRYSRGGVRPRGNRGA